MTDFNMAISIMEGYVPAMNNEAILLSDKGEYQNAIALFNEVLMKDDVFGEAYLNRGLVNELMGNLDGACSDWNRALELGMQEAAAYINECK